MGAAPGPRLRPQPSRPPVSASSWWLDLTAARGWRSAREKLQDVPWVFRFPSSMQLIMMDPVYTSSSVPFSPARRGTVTCEHREELNCMAQIINRKNRTRG
ncbi:mCG147584, partial [Mus musculus]